MSQYKEKFITLLEELFQLNQPELDFGLYRILHARSSQIKAFVQNELAAEIDQVFAGQSQASVKEQLHSARLKVEQTLGEYALETNGELKPEFAKTKIGQEYDATRKQALQGGGPLADDAQIYDHLYRFFSRYYDKGDFMSRRYFVAENDSRALPYAIPYDGREVMLHWANKDQYYIKSSEYLANFTVDLAAARKITEQSGQTGFDFNPPAESLIAHFRLAAASEGEHNNVKEGQERYFLIHSAEPVKLETNAQGQTELVIQFQYRPDPEKTGQSGTWQQKRLLEAEAAIQAALADLPAAAAHTAALFALAPTDKQPNRSLLGKYLGQYTSRNTMDYFIHKNLGGFLRRELDFYIKNEIMRLDDIENAAAPRVESYLKKLQSLRKIARRIIDFLAQIEDFQKKLWLKKKFVVETNYCITLDRIPETFYPEIAANDAQREEWVRLFAIDEIVADTTTPGYSVPLTVEFLRANRFLMVDTALVDENLKAALLANLEQPDEKTNGVLIHSENQQALSFISKKEQKLFDSIFIDPPYNTGNDGFVYKDSYNHSSWLSFMATRLEKAKFLMGDSCLFGATIDQTESSNLRLLFEEIFSKEDFIAEISWEKRYTRSNNAKKFYSLKDSLLVFGINTQTVKEERTESSIENYSNPDNDPRGDWISSSYVNPATKEDRQNLVYEILNPHTKQIVKHPTHAWKYDLSTHKKHIQENRLYWGKYNDYTYPRLKNFLAEASEGMVPVDIWKYQDAGTTDEGGNVLKDFFGIQVFNNPKPTTLVDKYTKLITNGKSANKILDFFAGSGTTGHAAINKFRFDQQVLNYTLIEFGEHFNTVLIPRLKKAIYSSSWKNGKPVARDGISHCFKYLRLESYEDTLNNLLLQNSAVDLENQPISAGARADFTRDYLLKYWLDFETAGSPSLLNVRQFADPTAYRLKVKQPGSEAQVEKTVDLIETFNWLIGLHVAQLDRPRRYAAELLRATDAELPADQDTRWICPRIDEQADGEFWFRWVEGHVLAVPGDESSRQRVLVLWRKLTGDAGRDQAVLEAYLAKKKLNPLESEFETIYINGSHALPSDGQAASRVRLIEETFAQRMWEDA